MPKRRITPERRGQRKKLLEMHRGIEDILIACVDGLTGFTSAIEAVFPEAEIQQCIIHQIRNTARFVSYKDIKF